MTLSELDDHVEFLLCLHRPDRYDPSDLSWAAPVMQFVKEQLAAHPELLAKAAS